VCDLKNAQTAQGFLFLAAVQHVYSRRSVGWSMRDDLQTDLVLDALEWPSLPAEPSAQAWSPTRITVASTPACVTAARPSSLRSSCRWGRSAIPGITAYTTC
jgi:hypothetical protein